MVSVGLGRGVGGADTCRLDTNTTHPWPPSPVYKTSLESVETSDSNPYIYYNMKLQAIIKSGMSREAEEMVWGPTPGVLTWGRPGPCKRTHAGSHLLQARTLPDPSP